MAPHTAVATGAGSGGEGPERHVDKPTVERVGVGRVHARRVGYERLTLWTNDPLVDARQLHLPAEFVLTGEEPHHSFGVHSVGQTYDLDLQPVPAPVPETRA